MSDNDQLRPFHARDAAPGQEAAEVVAEVLKHAAERDKAAHAKAAPKSQPKWVLPISINLGVIALYLLIAQPDFVVVNRIHPPPAPERIASLRTAMYFEGISKIESYRVANGRLPVTLEEAGGGSLVAAGVDYTVRGDSSYVLITTVGDEVIAFDSAQQTALDFAGNLNSKLPG